MITDDLAPLFGGSADAVRFRQGTVLAWNPSTGQNTIDVAGGILTDVSILNSGEAIALKAGHIVGLLTYGGAWFIIGRITSPGDANFASASVAFDTGSAVANNYALTTTYANMVTVTLQVPSWADEAAVIATASASLLNPRTVADYSWLRAVIPGSAGLGTVQGHAPAAGPDAQYYQGLSAGHAYVIADPGATIAVTAQMRSDGAAWSATAQNTVALSAMAIYRSTI